MDTTANKALVTRYNLEVIEKGNTDLLQEILTPDFINHSAMKGMPADVSGMVYFFSSILHPAFPDLKVTTLEMIAEGDKVVTRKLLKGTHQGNLAGIAPTGKPVTISVIDILQIEEDKIKAHWGENNFAAVMQALSAV